MRRRVIKTVGAAVALGMASGSATYHAQTPEQAPLLIEASPETTIVHDASWTGFGGELANATNTTIPNKLGKAAIGHTKRAPKPATTTAPTTTTALANPNFAAEQEAAVAAEQASNGVYLQEVLLPALENAGIATIKSSHEAPNEFMVSLDGQKATKFIVSDVTLGLQICLDNYADPAVHKNLLVDTFGDLDAMQDNKTIPDNTIIHHDEGPDQCGDFFNTDDPAAAVNLVVTKAQDVTTLATR